MKKILLFISFFILTATTATVFPQPSTIFNFVGGYTAPLADMKGDFGNTPETLAVNQETNSYLLRNGFNFGMNIKYAPFKDRRIKITGGIYYNALSRKRDYPDWEYPLNVEVNQRIFSISLGAELQYLTRVSRINPFASIELTANFFSGSYMVNYYQGDPVSYTLNPAARFGFQIGAGTDFVLGQRLGLVAGFKYNFANVFGKNTIGGTGKEYGLNDKEGEVRGTKYLTKDIQFLQIYAGFSLFLGL
jgi:hypothetical protein